MQNFSPIRWEMAELLRFFCFLRRKGSSSTYLFIWHLVVCSFGPKPKACGPQKNKLLGILDDMNEPCHPPPKVWLCTFDCVPLIPHIAYWPHILHIGLTYCILASHIAYWPHILHIGLTYCGNQCAVYHDTGICCIPLQCVIPINVSR